MDLTLNTRSATSVAEELRDWLAQGPGPLAPGVDSLASVFLIGSCTEDRIPESTWQDFDLHFAFDTVYIRPETLDWVRSFLAAVRSASTENCRVDGTVRDRHWKLTPDESVPNNVGIHATLLSRADHFRRVSVHALLADNMYTRCRVLRGVHPAKWQGRRLPTGMDYLHSVGGLGWLSENLARATALHLLDPDDHSFAPFVGGYCWNITGALLFHLYTIETGGVTGRHGALGYLRSRPDAPDDVLEQAALLEKYRLAPVVDAPTAVELWDACGRVLAYVGERILATLGCGGTPPPWEGVQTVTPTWASAAGDVGAGLRFAHVCRDETSSYTDGIRVGLDEVQKELGVDRIGVKEWPEFLSEALDGGPVVKAQVWDRFSRFRRWLSHDLRDDHFSIERAVFGWEDGAQALLQRLNEWSILHPGEPWLQDTAKAFHGISRYQLGSLGVAIDDGTTVDSLRRAVAGGLSPFLPLSRWS